MPQLIQIPLNVYLKVTKTQEQSNAEFEHMLSRIPSIKKKVIP